MSYASETVQQFREIAGSQLSDVEVEKYLKWGKGDLTVALSYFFNKQEKKVEQSQQVAREELPSAKSLGSSAFDQLYEGSKKHRELEKVVNEMRETHKRPIESAVEKDITERKKRGLPILDRPDNSINYIPNVLRKASKPGR